MLSEQELQSIAKKLQDTFQQLESDIVKKISERIGEIGSVKQSDIRRLEELSRIGYDIKEIEKQIAEKVKKSESEIYSLLLKAAENEYSDAFETMDKLHKKAIPFAENEPLQMLIESISLATQQKLRNMSGTTGFVNAVNKRGVKLKQGVWQELPKYYQNIVDYAALQIRTGQEDFHSAMRTAMKSMSDYGLSHVEYNNEKPIVRRLDTSVKSAILGAQARLSMAQAEIVREQIGADGMEITWHSGYRPTHTFGGKQFPLEEFKRDILPLMEEANCYHRAFPIIYGMSTPAYTQTELDELNAKEKEIHMFNGKPYNRYQSTQRQRRYETALRQQKDYAVQNAAAAKGAEKEGNTALYEEYKKAERNAKGKATAIREEYRQFGEAVGLSVKPNRMSVSKYTRGENLASVDGKKDTYFLLGKVDFNNKNMVKSTLEKYEKIIVKKDYENAIVITKSGNVYRVIGDEANVNPNVIVEDIKGSCVTHNHPKKTTHSSFSGDDIYMFSHNENSLLRGLDNDYIYEITRLPETKPIPENIAYEFDHSYRMNALERAFEEEIDISELEYHYINEEISGDYCYEYKRKKR